MAKSKGKSFSPETNIPDLSRKVLGVTWLRWARSTSYSADRNPILREHWDWKKACISSTKHSLSHLYILACKPKIADVTIDEIKSMIPSTNFTLVRCSLDSLSSVGRAAREIVVQTKRLGFLMCNADILQNAGPPGLSEDGFEVQFRTNHLGHALLIKILLRWFWKPLRPATTLE